MIDQYHLRATIDRYKEGLRCFGQNPDEIHWHSFAVLMAHGRRPEELYLRLFDGGWFRAKHNNVGEISLFLSPSGMPYYVDYSCHDTLVYECMGLSRRLLDEAGWLHISGNRVDIEARPTSAQERWLAANEPCLTGGNPWRRAVRHGGDNRPPKPYTDADKFNVRPVQEDDWDRLCLRIFRPVTTQSATDSLTTPYVQAD